MQMAGCFALCWSLCAIGTGATFDVSADLSQGRTDRRRKSQIPEFCTANFYLTVVFVFLALIPNASSTSRRIASGRPGLSDCLEAQSSIRRSKSG
jgi:hypothetical protein